MVSSGVTALLRGPTTESLGWLVVFQDLTEISSLEEQVRTRERMAALGEMAAGIAHELRNPLAAISGSVQVLHGSQAGTDRARLQEVVLRETERLNRTIRDFLAFARPGHRGGPVDGTAHRQRPVRCSRGGSRTRSSTGS